jgi:hypothetical protein
MCGVLGEAVADPEAHVRANLDAYVTQRVLTGHVVDRYWRANTTPSARYALSPPKRIRARLAPGGTRWTNLALAGDWTRTAINAGSFEAAVASGFAAAEALRRPRYAEYGGLRSVPAPLFCKGAEVYYFWVKVDPARVAALCKRVFDEPTGGEVRCEPLMGHVAISFGKMDVVARVPPYDDLGFVVEQHAAIWVPVRCSGPPGVPEMAAFLPQVWVDNPMSIAVGHDVFGYPKNQGWLSIDEAKGFALKSYAFARYGPDVKPGPTQLLEIAPGRQVRKPSAEADPDDLDEVAGMIRTGLGRRGAASVVSHLRLAVPQIFLRQFRAPDGGGFASSQQVVLASARVRADTLRLAKLGEHKLTVSPAPSEGLDTDLGLTSQDVDFALKVQMDFTVEPGRVVWDGAY